MQRSAHLNKNMSKTTGLTSNTIHQYFHTYINSKRIRRQTGYEYTAKIRERSKIAYGMKSNELSL